MYLPSTWRKRRHRPDFEFMPQYNIDGFFGTTYLLAVGNTITNQVSGTYPYQWSLTTTFS